MDFNESLAHVVKYNNLGIEAEKGESN